MVPRNAKKIINKGKFDIVDAKDKRLLANYIFHLMKGDETYKPTDLKQVGNIKSTR